MQKGNSSSFAVVGLAFATWTLVMMALAASGMFRPGALTAASIMLAAGVILYLSRTPVGWPRLDAIDKVAAVMLVAAAILYIGHPKESILGERDEGIYTQHALHLALTGGSSIDLASSDIAEAPQIAGIVRGEQPALPGIYPTKDRWTFQFSSAFPAWMAILKLLAGDAAMLRVNALLGLLNGLLFYLLLRCALPARLKPWTLALLACYAFNPAQVWISRNTLSEPLSSFFLLYGLLVACRPSRPPIDKGLLAGILIGMATFVRIDGVIYPVAIAMLWLASRIPVGTSAPIDHLLKRMAAGATSASALGLVYFGLFVPQYFADLEPFVSAASITGGIAIVLAIGIKRVSAHLPIRMSSPIPTMLALALLSVIAYALLLRPYLPPYSVIHSTLVPSLEGMRDFREASLPNLAAYLGLPTVLIAVAGACGFVHEACRRGLRSEVMVIAGILLVPCFVYLWNPMVSPDHIWASRRWLPAVFPGTLLFAAGGITMLCRRLPNTGWAQWGIPLLAATLAIASTIHRQHETLFVTEDSGTIREVAAIAGFLPQDRPTYVVDWPILASALLTAYDKPVVPVVTTQDAPLTLQSLVVDDRCTMARPCMVLYRKGSMVGGATTFATGSLRRLRRNTSPLAPARGMHTETSDYLVARIAHR